MSKEKPQQIVWFDLETGGLIKSKHQIIQVAAVATGVERSVAGVTFPFIDAFECKIKLIPGWWEQGALDMNSYDAEVWNREALDSDAARSAFTEFLRHHSTLERFSKKKQKRYFIAELAGHNLYFDVGFMRKWYGTQFNPSAAWTGGFYDTLQQAKWVTMETGKTFKSFKLTDLCSAFEIETPDAHDALEDVKATIRLSEELSRHLAGG